ncbi:MAG TPA: hypothetical protein PKK06_05475 [Phycisphaerae bacterium]|nr:hypothetical protein [Phycisphaerae bacterium]HNU44792.1 hypothetical protein [Phycisphaerae bacterium]
MQHYAIQHVNGQPLKVPVAPDGSIDVDVLCQLANVAPDRALVLQRPDGSNQLVPRGQKLTVRPGAQFVDAPTHRRGA